MVIVYFISKLHFKFCIAEPQLTSLVALLEVAVSRLHRCALTVVIDAVAGAATLLNASSTGHRTMSPFRPGGPAILSIVTGC